MNVELFYRDGRLKMFLDNWQFKTILGDPRVSSEEAVAKALKALRMFSYDVSSCSVSKFYIAQVENAISTSLCYVESGSEDGFILRPSWWVGIGFDRHYPGQVTGVTARIWADTGEVSSVSPMVFSGGSAIYEPDDTTVPDIEVLSPENKTYAGNEIILDFRMSEPVSWVDYSLNGQSNVTLDDRYIIDSGIISLLGLSEGSYTLQVYAGDLYGSSANIGASDLICFNITESPEPEPVLVEPEPSTTEPSSSSTGSQIVGTDSEVSSNDSGSDLADAEPESSITELEPEHVQKDGEVSESSKAKVTQTKLETGNPFSATLLMAILASVAVVFGVTYFLRRKKRRAA
jgi:hypothetical protein